MKKLLLLVFVLVLVSAAFAGKGKNCEDKKMSPEKMQEKHLSKLSKELKLSTDQEAAIDKIMKNGWDEMMKEKEEFQAKMKLRKEAKDAEIMTILNEDQKVKFQEICEKKMQKRWKEKTK